MTQTTEGGFDGDPLEALNPPAQEGGCCGSSVDATAMGGGCCG